MNFKRNRIPNFFILGAPKAGTTSLFDYIIQHPDVFPSKHKETHFFKNDELYNQGIEFYLNNYFKGAENYRMKGEATPAYLALADIVAPRIKDMVKGNPIKFIVILRDPVERAWSNYLHRKRKFVEQKSFKEALNEDKQRIKRGDPIFSCYFSGGLYGDQLNKWFKYFPKENFLIFSFEELYDTKLLLNKVFRFLDIDPNVFVSTNYKRNMASKPRFKWLSILKANSPIFIAWLFRNIVPDHKQHKYKVKITRMLEKPITEGKKPEMDENIKKRLRDMYNSDISKLEDLLGRNFAEWKE